jgi:peroxiredoxin
MRMTRRHAGLTALTGWLAGGTQWLEAAPGKFSNRRAPGFSLPDSAGKQYDGTDFRGKVLLLEFMQTKCPFCRAMSGVLEQTKTKFGDRIEVLSVVVMPDTPQNVAQYIKENNVRTPILYDCGQMTASYLRITPQNPTVRFPHLFLIDKDGVIRNDFDHDDAGSGKVTVTLLAAEVQKLLGPQQQGVPPAKKR